VKLATLGLAAAAMMAPVAAQADIWSLGWTSLAKGDVGSVRLTTANTLDSHGGYNVLNATGNFDNKAITGLTSPATAGSVFLSSDGKFSLDDVLFNSGQHVSGNGLGLALSNGGEVVLKGFGSGPQPIASTNGPFSQEVVFPTASRDSNGQYADLTTLKLIDLTSALNNSLHVTVDGSKISATFQPQGISLSDLASALGYTNFNWKQTITQRDSPYSGFAEQIPHLDPIEGGYSWDPPDHAFPYYYDQNNTSATGSNLRDATVGGNILRFYDQPANPCYGPDFIITYGCGDHVTDGYTYFTTDLVGVRANGSFESLAEFKWKSNFDALFRDGTVGVGPGGVVYNTTNLDEYIISSTGGSQLLSQQSLIDDSVPEPSTWALMILGFASVGALLRRRRLMVA
jgi:hypothetical protein